jgi:hypothetical protein
MCLQCNGGLRVSREGDPDDALVPVGHRPFLEKLDAVREQVGNAVLSQGVPILQAFVELFPILGKPVSLALGGVASVGELRQLGMAIDFLSAQVDKLTDDQRQRLESDETTTLRKKVWEACAEEPSNEKRNQYVNLLLDTIRNGEDVTPERFRMLSLLAQMTDHHLWLLRTCAKRFPTRDDAEAFVGSSKFNELTMLQARLRPTEPSVVADMIEDFVQWRILKNLEPAATGRVSSVWGKIEPLGRKLLRAIGEDISALQMAVPVPSEKVESGGPASPLEVTATRLEAIPDAERSTVILLSKNPDDPANDTRISLRLAKVDRGRVQALFEEPLGLGASNGIAVPLDHIATVWKDETGHWVVAVKGRFQRHQDRWRFSPF